MPSIIFVMGKPTVQVTKEQLEMAAFKNEITGETLYSYERARKWYPLSRLIGDVSKLRPEII